MDFYRMSIEESKKGEFSLTPNFTVGRSADLMVRGRAFYAVWNEQAGLWSTDEYDVVRLVDQEMLAYVQEKMPDKNVSVKLLENYNSQSWTKYRMFVSNISDSYHQLDQNLTFANQQVRRSDYVSKRLPYSLEPGDMSAWNELVGTLYSVEERAKIEWAIGAIVSGDSKKIQKFFVLYGAPGTGKGTVLHVIEKLFQGYTATFEAKALGSSNGSFATEAFKTNPLVALQHDADLSRIDDNTRLNSIVSHEPMQMNEKYKPAYTSIVNALLFIGTNLPVKISDAKSGIIRRLIDINPTGVTIPANQYNTLVSRVDFELGAIAYHCLAVYRSMGKNYYNAYRPTEMMLQTDVFFNFIEAYYDVFKFQDGVSLKQAYALYKEYCSDSGIERPLPQYKVREELRNYFDHFKDRADVDGSIVRSYYQGFNANKFKAPKNETAFSLVVDETVSLLDEVLADQPAQLSSSAGTPTMPWAEVSTKLSDLNTNKEHFVLVPENHIVIDFDLKGEDGGKALARNLEAASTWPPTYAELSKSGNGVHLHYDYEGDVSKLSRIFSEGIEVKVFTGKASLRRRLSKCNAVEIAAINSGLPLKKESPVLAAETVKSERGLRDLIARNMRKEIHPGTKPSVDFIAKILDDAYASGMSYDVSDLRARLYAFANNSTNQPFQALKVVQGMKFTGSAVPMSTESKEIPDERLVFYDVEVYPNLFVVCWKYEDVPESQGVRMINPTAEDMERLMKFKLVGFYNRGYDNHIIYGRYMGFNNQQLYELSQRLLNKSSGGTFAAAYSLSYTDVYDFSSKKQSLKKFEIEYGIKHMEMDHPWDQPVPEELFEKVCDYCMNDVVATEVTFKERKQDFVARQILAELSGLTVNDPTAKHTAAIIFQGDRRPQDKFVYTDLSKEFPGYSFDRGKSLYRGEDPGEGGYVYAKPGMYENVTLLDVASMHPTSIILMNMFGPYTPNYKDLMDARLAIKHGDYKAARKMLNGKLAPYLKDETTAKDLSYALKIVINIVYGLTSATFDSPFRDNRNKDNIAAKRGALFMIDLKNAVEELGYNVVHIKTDSIKIADADDEIIQMVMNYGAKYGYTFENEGTYDRFCLVNDAVYIARKSGEWTAVGAQFQHPYVFKTLFSGEEIQPDDLAETKQVSKGAMYLDFDMVQRPMHEYKGMHFVGRTGRFVPVTEECNIGGILTRVDGDKSYAVGGTKGYFWIEAEMARALGLNLDIDYNYFERLVAQAKSAIEKFGSFEEFVT